MADQIPQTTESVPTPATPAAPTDSELFQKMVSRLELMDRRLHNISVATTFVALVLLFFIIISGCNLVL